MAQNMRPSGVMADANARATARGYTDLHSQGVKDLGSIQGIQGNLYNQDLAKSTLSSNAQLAQQKEKMGQANLNMTNSTSARQSQLGKFGKTLEQAGSFLGLG